MSVFRYRVVVNREEGSWLARGAAGDQPAARLAVRRQSQLDATCQRAGKTPWPGDAVSVTALFPGSYRIWGQCCQHGPLAARWKIIFEGQFEGQDGARKGSPELAAASASLCLTWSGHVLPGRETVE